MIQVKIFGAISDALSNAKESVEQQVNEWLSASVPAGAMVQSSSTLTYANGRYHLMITLTITTPSA